MNPKLRMQARLKALRASDVAATNASCRFPRCIHHSRSRKSFLCRNTLHSVPLCVSAPIAVHCSLSQCFIC